MQLPFHSHWDFLKFHHSSESKKRMNEKQQQRYRSNRLILTNTNNNTVAKIARRYERELPNWIEHSREAAISRSYVQRESHCFANVS